MLEKKKRISGEIILVFWISIWAPKLRTKVNYKVPWRNGFLWGEFKYLGREPNKKDIYEDTCFMESI